MVINVVFLIGFNIYLLKKGSSILNADELKDVMIDGEWVMKGREVLNIDERQANDKLQIAGEHVWASVNPEVASSADELSPQTFPKFEG